MAKRFTDNEKWKKQWFRKLPNDMKVFWIYICDTCNIAGVWDVDFEMAHFMTGTDYHETVVLKYMDKQIEILSITKWLIKDFVTFQYGTLVPNNNLHKSVLNLLQTSKNEGLLSPSRGDKVKVRVKVLSTSTSPAVQEVFGYFCLKGQKKISLSPEREKIIANRLQEGRTKLEMCTAIDNFFKDDWPDRHRFEDIVYCLGVHNKVDNLDKWLAGPKGTSGPIPAIGHTADCPDCRGSGLVLAPGSGKNFPCTRKVL